jgi:hypothetical protein
VSTTMTSVMYPTLVPLNNGNVIDLSADDDDDDDVQIIEEVEEVQYVEVIDLTAAPIVDLTAVANEPVTHCVICLSDVTPGENARYLPCMHGFHEACVAHWLATTQ